MTTSIELGFQPIPLTVALSRESDFVAALVAAEPWPVDVGIDLVFTASPTADPIIWPASIDGPRAGWDVPQVEVREVLDADATRVRLRYTEPDGTVLTWARGSAVSDG